MKKVAVITVYNACNYGSFLQAYALMRTIESLGYQVTFLKLPAKEEEIIGVDRLPPDSITYEKLKYDKLRMDREVFDVTSKVDDSFQCSVIGSDTVWNLFDPAYGHIPYFVGKEISSKRIISYAASVGQAGLLKILLLKGKDLLPIRKMDQISVRDDKTEAVVRLLGRHSKRVLDPTFLYNFKSVEPDIKLPEKFLLVYTYGFSAEEVSAVQKYAKDQSLKIIATGSLCKWADFNMVVNSFEWLWLIEHAYAIVTSTFHGSVFSIKYNKRFAVLAQGSDKINSLLREFGLEDRVCSHENLHRVLDTGIDNKKVEDRVNRKVVDSITYLKEGIGDCVK
ncbi:MAG: polysaccharide pyruvyl transferase family protein [Eubacteriales bacterium]